jgi:hypothetical protein
MRKLFGYAHRPLLHVQIYCRGCGCCAWCLRPSSGLRLPAHHYVPGRPNTFPVCANRSNMFSNLRFMLGYVFPAMIVVWSAPIEFWLARLAAYGRPPAHHYAPSRPSTFPVCSNRSNMFPDLRFVLVYTFPAVVVVWSAPIEFWLARLALPKLHLVVLALFPYAQIIRIYSTTFVSCLRIHFLLWWLRLVPPSEF